MLIITIYLMFISLRFLMIFMGVSFNIILSWTMWNLNFLATNLIKKRDSYVLYLQLLANAYFDFVKKNVSSQNTARDILVEENEMAGRCSKC